MIYTSYEMLRDCRAGKPEGWSYFIANYVPVIRKLLTHYGGERAPAMETVLAGLHSPESSLFTSLDPAPERWVVAELRQKIMADLSAADSAPTLELETVAAALAPLTLLEKQAAWLESMRYEAGESAAMLRMSAATVTKIRDRAAELLRSAVDTWNRNLLVANGRALGRAAAAAPTPECVPSKTFLDVLDGRSTWRDRETIERHVIACWHCIDHFCRMAEVIELLRNIQPLSDAEAAPFRQLLGLVEQKPAGWKRLFGAR
jgi:hypothetical protein